MQGERKGMNIQACPGLLGVPDSGVKHDYSLLHGEQEGPDRCHRTLEIPSIN